MSEVQPLFRQDTATTLRRFFQCERSLTIACAAWTPGVDRLETKELLARSAWENSLTAAALRQRVFELRYPERDLLTGTDTSLVELLASVIHAPGAGAFLTAVGEVFAPALRDAYRAYLEASDVIADGPTRRFLNLARDEKAAQCDAFVRAAEAAGGSLPAAHREWIDELTATLAAAEGATERTPGRAPAAPESAFELPHQPARDDRFLACSFYWPDNFDPSYPYGDGVRLRLRSAVSHLNEVWAVETAGAILHAFADRLGWDYIEDAARWLYDESRHMMMGANRLTDWGFDRADIPLGSFIYEACRGQDPIYRLGMLAFFETKNIGKKKDRAVEFAEIGDQISRRDMDFDWADEAIHAGYGRKWIKALLDHEDGSRGWHDIVARCESLVQERIDARTLEEERITRAAAERLIEKAERRLT
jgi:hypothetical protein